MRDRVNGLKLLFHESEFPTRLEEQLRNCLARRRIQPKWHYLSAAQTQAWLRLHAAYSPAICDPECVGVYDAAFGSVAQITDGRPVHLIGLGCGGGQKEVRLAQRLACVGRAVSATMVDASAGMVLTAQQALQAVLPEGAVSGIVMDLDNLEAGLHPGVSREEGGIRRVVCCFGVLPNMNPPAWLGALRRWASPGDEVLLSANLVPAADYPGSVASVCPLYDNALTREWLMRFLLDCGFERDDGVMRFSVEPHPGLRALHRVIACFEFVRECRVTVGGEEFGFGAGDCLELFGSNRFTPALFRAMVEGAGWRVTGEWITLGEEEGVIACTPGVRVGTSRVE